MVVRFAKHFWCAAYFACRVPLPITWLDKLRPNTSLRACNNFHRPNNTHLEASLIKVMHIIIVDAILGYCLLYKLEPRAYYHRVLLLDPLDVLCAIERHLEPLLTRHKPLHPVLAHWLYTPLSKYLVCYISNLSL